MVPPSGHPFSQGNATPFPAETKKRVEVPYIFEDDRPLLVRYGTFAYDPDLVTLPKFTPGAAPGRFFLGIL